MPYPKPTDPHYCKASGLPGEPTETRYVRCVGDDTSPGCGRLISTRKGGTFPHSVQPQQWDRIHQVIVDAAAETASRR